MIPVIRGKYIGVYARNVMSYRITLFDSNTSRGRLLDVSDICYSVLNALSHGFSEMDGILILVDKRWKM